MKYTSLKKQPLKSFKIRALNGGVDCENNTDGMFDGKISACKNMWYKNSRLQTRPGFKGEAESAVNAMIYGNEGELDYKVTDTVIYRSGEYCRLATAQITVDDSVHYTYVYLLDLFGNITPIGQLSFSRFSSDSFYLPTQIHFFNGKPQKNGGGIYAMVTLCDRYDVTKKNHYIYEVNSKLDEWVKVENFYIPTALTNGRGNKYQQSKNETGFSTPSPIILESQNMLEERFYSYFTSDGFSNSFKLPYSNLSNEEISCRVYYDLDKYVEWVIQPGYLRATKTFNEVEITAYIDRVTGTLYFKSETDDYSVPVMPMYSENNIKVTAAKKINNGFSKIVSASCVTRHNSKLLVAGGENGNTVFTGDYDNPLYFPYSSSVQVGEGSNKITHMSSQQGKVLVFKENELHLLTVNEGKAINEISLIRDNDKRFRTSDSFACEQISSSIGCDNNATVAVCGKHSYWVGGDNKIYTFDVSGKKLKEVCFCSALMLDNHSRAYATAIGGDEYYFLIFNEKIAVVDVGDNKNYKVFYWETPEGINIESGFYFAGNFWFLCTASVRGLVYVAHLEGKNDSIMYISDDKILKSEAPISCGFTTKQYNFGDARNNKNIEGVYLNLSAAKKVSIEINDIYKTEVNFGFLNEDYDKCEHKSVRLSPHIRNSCGVKFTFAANGDMSLGDIEIQYRVTG